MQHNPRHGGFSLIEVLVAFVLLSMTLAVVLQIFSGGLRNAGAAQHFAQAMVLADSRLELIGADPALGTGSTQGKEGEFTWQLDIAPFIDPSMEEEGERPTSSELLEVTVTVRWRLGSREQALTLNTLKLAAAR